MAKQSSPPAGNPTPTTEVVQEVSVPATPATPVATAAPAPPVDWSAARAEFRASWAATRSSRRQAVSLDEALTAAASNPVGRGVGRMRVSIVNTLDDQPALYLGLQDQVLRLTLEAGGANWRLYAPDVSGGTASSGEPDSIRLRFRPGALADCTPALQPAVAGKTPWALSDTTTGGGVRELTVQAVGAPASETTSTSVSLTGLVPSAELGGHALRVEVAWRAHDAAGARVEGVRSLHLAVMQPGAGLLRSLLDEHALLRDHHSALDGLHRTLRTDHDTLQTNHDTLSARHGSLDNTTASVQDDILRMAAHVLDPELEAWIEGDGVLAPSLERMLEVDNALTLCVRNPKMRATTLSNTTLRLDLGTDPATGLAPQGVLTATWTLDTTTARTTDIAGTEALQRTIPTWEPGQTVRIKLANLKLPASAMLGDRVVRVEYAGTTGAAPQADAACLGSRRSEGGHLTFGGGLAWDRRAGEGAAWTFESRVRLPRLEAEGKTYEMLRLGADAYLTLYAVPAGFILFQSFVDPTAIRGFTPGFPTLTPGEPFRRLSLTYRDGTLTAYVDGVEAGTASLPESRQAAAAGTVTSVGGWALTSCSLRDVRIWNRALSAGEIRAYANGQRPLSNAPGLLVDLPLDDLDNVPRNRARFGTVPRPNPTLGGAWRAPVPAPTRPPEPIAGSLKLAVAVGNVAQTAAGSTTLHGKLTAAIIEATGSVTGQTMTSKGLLTALRAEVTERVKAAELEAPVVRGDPKSIATNSTAFHASRLGGGRYISLRSPPSFPTTGWTAQATFRWPLPAEASYNTLFRGETALHHLIVLRADLALGAYFSGSFHTSTYSFPAGMSTGEHRIAVVYSGTALQYYVDGLPVGSGVEMPASVSEGVKTIGDYSGGGQSFGPVTEVRLWSVVRSAAQVLADTFADPPALSLTEGGALPADATYESGAIPASVPVATTRTDVGRLVPAGTIIMWSGTIETIPFGWHLCDGRTLTGRTNTAAVGLTISTPDLRGRMARGVAGTPGDKGGSDLVTLAEEHLPSHSHPYSDMYWSEHWGTVDLPDSIGSAGGTTDNDNKGYVMARMTSAVGSGRAFSVVPAYYALAYLIFQPEYA